MKTEKSKEELVAEALTELYLIPPSGQRLETLEIPDPDPVLMEEIRQSILEYAGHRKRIFLRAHWKKLVAAAACAAILSATAYAKRDEIYQFFIYNDRALYVSNTFITNDGEYLDLTGFSCPTYIPDGYFISGSSQQEKSMVHIVWENGGGQKIEFVQFFDMENTIGLEGENPGEVQYIDVNGQKGVCIPKGKNYTVLTWGTNPQNTIYGDINQQTATRIAQSVCVHK